MRVNPKARDHRLNRDVRVAGGFGIHGAVQSDEALLRRVVMANLLWEDNFYEDGMESSKRIAELVPKVEPEVVAEVAREARVDQKLRHVPLFLAAHLARSLRGRRLLGDLLPAIILRADEITEFMALYWQNGRCPIAKQVKRGLARAFENFDAYQFAKYDRRTEIKLRDVMRLVHPKPGQGRSDLYKQVIEGTLTPPDTWEVSLSRGEDKRDTWTRLIRDRKLGALAFLRNLRNMHDAEVDYDTLKFGFDTVNARWLLPVNYISAAREMPRYEQEIEGLMLRGLASAPKLPGHTVFVVDVSGSMRAVVSGRSRFSRMHVACAMAMLANEMCERISVYATAGSDRARRHSTSIVPPRRGFGLMAALLEQYTQLGGGGIFTRQCLEFIRRQERDEPERIVIFSDSQDCDVLGSGVPDPFGKRNYIIDVSAHKHGIAYRGVWDAEVSGWSEHFLKFIAAFEGATESNEQG